MTATTSKGRGMAEAIVNSAKRWHEARLASQAASSEKRVAGIAYCNDPAAMSSGALLRYADACRLASKAKRREKAALLALEKACATLPVVASAEEGDSR